MRLAAIDIGSNAVRLLIVDATLKDNGFTHFKKLKLYRMPVRLGGEAFNQGHISDQLINKFCKAMNAFSLMMEVYEVDAFRACATSALREAKNSEVVIGSAKMVSGIGIEVINGDEEAELILGSQLDSLSFLDQRFNHLYVDVGGGSTEISIVGKDGIGKSRSFKIGTIRLFSEQVKDKDWKELAKWLSKEVNPKMPLSIIGSGGNINRILKRANLRPSSPIIYNYLKEEHALLSKLSVDERILTQDLNRDRAEVIVPALDIFLYIMDQTKIRQVVVPKIGLADGIIKTLYKTEMAKELKAKQKALKS